MVKGVGEAWRDPGRKISQEFIEKIVLNLGSRYRVRRQLRPLELSSKLRDMPVVPTRGAAPKGCPASAQKEERRKNCAWVCLEVMKNLLSFCDHSIADTGALFMNRIKISYELFLNSRTGRGRVTRCRRRPRPPAPGRPAQRRGSIGCRRRAGSPPPPFPGASVCGRGGWSTWRRRCPPRR